MIWQNYQEPLSQGYKLLRGAAVTQVYTIGQYSIIEIKIFPSVIIYISNYNSLIIYNSLNLRVEVGEKYGYMFQYNLDSDVCLLTNGCCNGLDTTTQS